MIVAGYSLLDYRNHSVNHLIHSGSTNSQVDRCSGNFQFPIVPVSYTNQCVKQLSQFTVFTAMCVQCTVAFGGGGGGVLCVGLWGGGGGGGGALYCSCQSGV